MNPILMLSRAIARHSLVTLFLLFTGLQSFSIAQSTTFQISGYCYAFTSASQVGHCDISGGFANGLVVQGNYAYIADTTFGLRIIDISNPSNPNVVGNCAIPSNPNGVAVAGHYAYLADGTSGLIIIDISSPANPIEVGHYDTNANAFNITIQDNYAYVANAEYGLLILDISNPQNPTLVSSTQISGNINIRGVTVQGNYAYVTNWGWNNYPETQDIDAGMYILDISDRTNPKLVSNIHTDTKASGILVKGNYAYLTELGKNIVFDPVEMTYYYLPPQLHIVDISNVTSLSIIGSYVVATSAYNMALNSNYAYLATDTAGLTVIDMNYPSTLFQVDQFTMPGEAHGVAIVGNSAYVGDGDSGLYILNIANPLQDVKVSLSGDTNEVTSVDSAGYYEFAELSFGNYTVTPLRDANIFNPPLYSFISLTTDQSEQNFINYYGWTNSIGSFETDTDTTFWAFEIAPRATRLPTFAWLSTYQGKSGILQINFSTETQGVKMTSFPRFISNINNSWYRLRVTYYCDTPYNGIEMIPIILLYSEPSSNTITEIGDSYTGNSLIQTNTWNTQDAYIYSRSNAGQVQIIFRNNGNMGNIYIDSIELDNTTPPAISNPTRVNVIGGTFDNSTEIGKWAFENAPNAFNGRPQINWKPTVSAQTGILVLGFTTTNQGVKITSKDVYDIPAGANAIMSFKIATNQSNPSTLNILGFQYAEKNVQNQVFDVSGYANSGILQGDWTWTTYYVPLTSLSQSTHRLQLIIRNNGQYPETVYLDDIELFYSSNVSDGIRKWVGVPKEELGLRGLRELY